MEAQSWQKEQISRAFLLALATRESCTIGQWNVDKDGVDSTLKRRSLMVDVQLKCTSRLRPSGKDFAFDLEVETYEKLRDPDRSAPAYLVVLEVPPEPASWIEHADDYVLLRCRAFYAPLLGMPATKNSSTVAIALPSANRLDGTAIEEMFRQSRSLRSGAVLDVLT